MCAALDLSDDGLVFSILSEHVGSVSLECDVKWNSRALRQIVVSIFEVWEIGEIKGESLFLLLPSFRCGRAVLNERNVQISQKESDRLRSTRSEERRVG